MAANSGGNRRISQGRSTLVGDRATVVEETRGQGLDNGIRFRVGDFSPRDRAIARDEYESMVRRGGFQFSEAIQDSMLGLKRLYQAILGKGTRMEDVAGND